jgi:hypothetical protein
VKKLRQRLRYGFALEESWEFKSWCGEACSKRLKHLRDNLNGNPQGLTQNQWIEILDKIIWSFENHDVHIPYEYSEDYDHRYKVRDSGNVRHLESLNTTGTIDRSKSEEHHKRIVEGLELFAKYFRSLWD